VFLEKLIVLPAIVLEATAAAELPGANGRREAFALRAQRVAACRTELATLESRALDILPMWSRRQKTAAERTVAPATQFELTQRKMQTILATGEKVELLVRDDEAIGK